ncbi:MAG: diadenylate cyclase CdaA [Anaerolineae bacterium]
MDEVLQNLRLTIQWAASTVDFFTIIDLLLVTGVFYGLLYLIRGTQAVQLLRGFLLLTLIVVVLSNVLQLRAFNWLLRNSFPALLISIPVIFQPEIRRGLERLGRAGRFITPGAGETPNSTSIIPEVARAVGEMSERHHGALIVIEQDTGLQEFIDTGEKIDSSVTADLLMTIFFPKTALHDGAVIVRGNRIAAARCVLPLAMGREPDSHLGTRHLAAIGVTERTDAVAVVVSEETGTISLVRNGIIRRRLDEGQVARLLYRWYRTPATSSDWLTRWFRGSQDGTTSPPPGDGNDKVVGAPPTESTPTHAAAPSGASSGTETSGVERGEG